MANSSSKKRSVPYDVTSENINKCAQKSINWIVQYFKNKEQLFWELGRSLFGKSHRMKNLR